MTTTEVQLAINPHQPQRALTKVACRERWLGSAATRCPANPNVPGMACE